MKPWNGRASAYRHYQVPASADATLINFHGMHKPRPDATFVRVLETIPATCQIGQPLVKISPEFLLTHIQRQGATDCLGLHSSVISGRDGLGV